MRIGVLTGGGDCPGLNPAIRGVVYRAIDYNDEVIGIRAGWKGLLEKDTVPLRLEDVEEIISMGGTILHTSRTNPLKKEEDTEKCIKNFKELGLDALIAIGGDDTLSVANALYKRGLPTVGVPKTMDNDLSGTDVTFGFDTAVTVAMDALARLKDTARSHFRVMVFEVMGRHAGWVALYTAVGGGADYVLIPEIPLDMDALTEHIKKVRARGKPYAVIVASEGVELPVEEEEEVRVDAFGHKILRERQVASWLADQIEKRTGFETRWVQIGHIQRGGPPTLYDRIIATRVGIKAVDMVHNGEFGKMAAIKGQDVVSVSLDEAVGKLKTVPPELFEEFKTLFK
ncbi:ATP-dependent 6-phosphofructokinase [bacterium]|nr:ATP-dependent 6-phosphofructokinase [bacterium]